MTREQQLRAFVLSLAAFATEDTSNNQVYSRGQPLTKASSVACLSLSQYLDDTESRRGVQKNLKTTRQSFQVNVFTNNICSWLRPRRGRGGLCDLSQMADLLATGFGMSERWLGLWHSLDQHVVGLCPSTPLLLTERETSNQGCVLKSVTRKSGF